MPCHPVACRCLTSLLRHLLALNYRCSLLQDIFSFPSLLFYFAMARPFFELFNQKRSRLDRNQLQSSFNFRRSSFNLFIFSAFVCDEAKRLVSAFRFLPSTNQNNQINQFCESRFQCALFIFSWDRS
ncbi:hypothetical protein BT69DRAFT_350768 [Atractiella rhizophila]|nr:hypothetical protein BT69DRAFT_350768 [Atractiella rhizophila]